MRLSNIRRELSRNQSVPTNILSAISLADSSTNYEGLPWSETGEVFLSLLQKNEITIQFPILKSMKGGKDDRGVPWDYPERDWYYWVHLLAYHYGWTLDYIAELDIDDALALLQEIEVESQIEKEWEYQISEIAYPYDPGTKKSVFKPLGRPQWMRREAVVQKRRILKAHLPIGVIIKVNQEDENKTTEHPTGV